MSVDVNDIDTQLPAAVVPAEITRALDPRIDALERVLVENLPPVELELNHQFIPGLYGLPNLYIRTIKMPKDSLVTSKIHKTRHPWFLLEGHVLVRDNEGEWHEFKAPYQGVTEPGTRRVIRMLEDTVWITVHATLKTTPQEVEDEIIHKHDEHLGGVRPQLKEITS